MTMSCEGFACPDFDALLQGAFAWRLDDGVDEGAYDGCEGGRPVSQPRALENDVLGL